MVSIIIDAFASRELGGARPISRPDGAGHLREPHFKSARTDAERDVQEGGSSGGWIGIVVGKDSPEVTFYLQDIGLKQNKDLFVSYPQRTGALIVRTYHSGRRF